MWLKCTKNIQAKIALAGLLGLLVMVVGCARNGSDIAESAEESTSSKVANSTAEKRSYLSRLASLRKREVVEDQPLVRDAFLGKENNEEEMQNPFGQLVANRALIDSLPPKSENVDHARMLANSGNTPAKQNIPSNPFLVSQTKTKQVDKNKFMSMDQFLATVESSPKPPEKKEKEIVDSKVAKKSNAAPFPNMETKITEKKSPFSNLDNDDQTTGFAFLAERKSEKKEESLDWNPDSDAKLWTPGVDQKGSAVDPVFANFKTEPQEKTANPLENLVENSNTKSSMVGNSSVDPAFANFNTDENKDEAGVLKIAEMKSPFDQNEGENSDVTSETALSKLRADLEEKASNTKKAAFVASTDKRVQTVIQRLLKSSESMIEDGHYVSAKQFASEAKILADQTDIMFGPSDLRPDDFLQKIAGRMNASVPEGSKSPGAKGMDIQNASLTSNAKLADLNLKKEVLDESKSEANELPLIVSSPLKEYRAKPGSGFNVAMVRSNAPVSLASFITNVPEGEESKKEKRTPLFDFEKEHKQSSSAKIESVSISKSSIPGNTNRSLILKSPDMAGEIPKPQKEMAEKSFLPNAINLNLPEMNDDAPLPNIDSNDSLVMLPATDSTRDMELKTQKSGSKVSSFEFPKSLYDGSRGPVIPMLSSFLGGAFLITLLLYFRRR